MVDHDHTANPADIPLKRCAKCGETKPHNEFSRSKRDGLQPHCKQCIAKYYRENTDKLRERNARYRRENPDEIRERNARYRSENADKIHERKARYSRENADKLRERNARYRSENADKVRECQARWHQANPDKVRERHARYRSENPDKVRESKARYYRENADKIHESQGRYRSANADKINEYQARWQRENPEKKREYAARWRQANPDKTRANSHRRRATKRALPAQWTSTDIQRMLAYWDNRCAICEQKVEPNNAFYFLAADHWIALTSPECPGTVPCNMLPLCHSKIGSALGCNNSKHDADPIEWLHSRYPDDPKLVTKILSRIEKYFKYIKAIKEL